MARERGEECGWREGATDDAVARIIELGELALHFGREGADRDPDGLGRADLRHECDDLALREHACCPAEHQELRLYVRRERSERLDGNRRALPLLLRERASERREEGGGRLARRRERAVGTGDAEVGLRRHRLAGGKHARFWRVRSRNWTCLTCDPAAIDGLTCQQFTKKTFGFIFVEKRMVRTVITCNQTVASKKVENEYFRSYSRVGLSAGSR